MTDESTTRNNWQGLIPRGRAAIISLVIVAVVAFSLGGLLSGGGDAPEATGSDGHAHTAESSEPTMWTCSMHPQIQLPKEGKCPICFMDMIPVETGGGGSELEPNQLRLSETAVQLAGVQTTPVVRAFAERSIRMVGKLDSDETRVSYITARVPGRLDSLFVDYTGATVAKGDRLVPNAEIAYTIPVRLGKKLPDLARQVSRMPRFSYQFKGSLEYDGLSKQINIPGEVVFNR